MIDSTVTGASQGTSRASNKAPGFCGCHSGGSMTTTGDPDPEESRNAASLSKRWRIASGSSAGVGPGPPDEAPVEVTTTLC